MSKLIRTSCAVTALLCFLFSVSYINYYQFNRPLGTDAMFHLSMSNTQLSKSDIISDLNDIANRNDTYFYYNLPVQTILRNVGIYTILEIKNLLRI